METISVLILVGAGLAGGFVAGLLGLGGGVIFAPVLLFFFRHQGASSEMVSKLTAGSSLFCTLLAASASTWSQLRKQGVAWKVVALAGPFSAGAVLLVTRYVTTQPWYDQAAFQGVFSLVLLVVAGRIVGPSGATGEDETKSESSGGKRRAGLLAGTGAAAGSIAAAAGVGGGIVLVPAYDRFLRMPLHRAVGTSSATIVLISAVGALSYAALGWGAPTPDLVAAVGYVDVGHALLLAGPALLSAQLGVSVSHRIRTRALAWSFAGVALVVAVRMLYGALS